MRTRSRSTPGTVTWAVQRKGLKGSSVCSDYTYTDTSATRNYTEYAESMQDLLGRKNENYCFHSKTLSSPGTPGGYLGRLTTPDGYHMDVYGVGPTDYDTGSTYSPHSLIDLDDVDWYSMYLSALPRIKQEMDESFANFAIDTPSLLKIRKLKPRIEVLKPLLRNFRSFKGSVETLKVLVSRAADANLLLHFGIMPLFDEIPALIRSVSAARAQYNRLKDLSNKWITRHVRFIAAPSSEEIISSSSPSLYVTCTNTKSITKRYVSNRYINSDVRCLKIRYKYQIPELPDWLAITYSTLDSLGLNLNPKIVWDATRYSFVVDWFLKVSPFLNNLSTPLLSPTTVVYKCVYSRRMEVKTVVKIDYSDSLRDVVCRDTLNTVYKRWVGIPPMSQIRLTPELDWFKVHIGTSLLVQSSLKH